MFRVAAKFGVYSALVAVAALGCSSSDKKSGLAQSAKVRGGSSTLVEEEVKLTPRKKETPTNQMLVDFANFEITVKNYDKAVKLFEQALKKDKSYGPAYAGLARVYFEQQQPSKAMETLQRGLKRAPKSPEIWNEIGVAKAKAGDYRGGAEAIETALKHSPQNPNLTENLAGMVAMTGDFQRGFELYVKLLPAAEARYRLATIRESRGDRSGALADLQLALQADAQFQPAVEMFAALAARDDAVKPATFTTDRRN